MYNRDKKEKRIIDDSLLFLAHKIFLFVKSLRGLHRDSLVSIVLQSILFYFFSI